MEILQHQWIKPAKAHAHHSEGEIDLAPPTWITLYQLCQYDSLSGLLDFLNREPEKYYETRIVKDSDGQRVAMWEGDDGYEPNDADVPGARHRLILRQDGFVFDNTVASYSD